MNGESGAKVEIAGRTRCPCGSGKTYSKCCSKKNFKWVKDAAGQYYRSVPMHPVVESVLKEQKKRFRRIFGRLPEGGDPLFFEGIDADSSAEISRELMFKSGVDPALIYAHQKTGLLVTEFNKDLMPDVDLDEWQAAIEEFKVLEATRKKPSRQELLAIRKWSKLEPTFRDILTVSRMMLLEYGQAKNLSEIDKVHSLNDMFFLCVAKTVKSGTAVLDMGERGFGEDALTVCRSMLEAYFTISFLIRNPLRVNDIVSCVVAVTAGVAEERFVKIDGVKTRAVVEKASGNVIGRSVSVWDKAKNGHWPQDIDLYKVTYSYLSDFAHPSIYSIEAYVRKDGGFNVFGREKVLHAYLYGALCLLLVLDTILFSKVLSEGHRKDLHYAVQKFSRIMKSLFSDMQLNKDGGTPQFILKRLADMGHR
jgi:hypothetical protein